MFSICAVFSVIASLRMEQSIPFQANEKKVISAIFLSILINLIFFSLSLSLILLFNMTIISFISIEQNNLILIPFLTFILCMVRIFTSANNYYKSFSKIAISKNINSFFTAMSQIILGMMGIKFGLTYGITFGQFITSIYLFPLNRVKKIFNVSKKSLKKSLTENRRYIFFDTPAALVDTASAMAPNFILIFVYSSSVLGYFSFVERTLFAPLSLIGVSIAQVLTGYAYEDFSKQRLFKMLINHLKISLLILIPVVVVGFFIIEDSYIFIFGTKWTESALYAKWLFPAYLSNIIFTSLSPLIFILKAQKFSLLFHLILLSIKMFILLFVSEFLQPLDLIKLLSLFIFLSYFVFTLFLMLLLKRKERQNKCVELVV